jgi:capsular exopolysaccharide synthesis family protein
MILLPLLAVAASVAAAESQTPRYRSSTQILLAQTQAESLFNTANAANAANPDRLLANQILVLRSVAVTDLVTKRLGFVAAIQATPSTTQDVITLTAVSPDPSRAASVANAYAAEYIAYRLASGSSQNAAAQAELRHQIDGIQSQIDALDQAVQNQPASQRSQLSATQAPGRQTLESQLATQRGQLNQLQAAAAVDQGGAQQLAPAAVPAAPFSPKPFRSGLLGLVLGLMFAVGLAFLLDYLDVNIRGKEDLERAAGNIPVIGLIPTLPDAKPGGHDKGRAPDEPSVVSIDEPQSASAEAYRTLRTSIQFLALDRSLRTIQVTSPTTSEGKTTTLVNLAVALARADQRVIVVDCDLRRPRVHAFFHLDPRVGITSVLLGTTALSLAIRPVPGVDGLRVLVAGPIPPNPSELLSEPRTSEILEILQAEADFVLVDSPPVLPVSDAVVLASRVDATLMVVNNNKTHRKQLSRALELLRQVDATVVGTVLNRLGSGETYGYEYGYVYGYAPRETPIPRPKRRRADSPPRTARVSVEAETEV